MENGDIALNLMLALDEVSAVCSGRFIPDTHWIGWCVGHRAILPAAEMKETLATAGEEP